MRPAERARLPEKNKDCQTQIKSSSRSNPPREQPSPTRPQCTRTHLPPSEQTRRRNPTPRKTRLLNKTSKQPSLRTSGRGAKAVSSMAGSRLARGCTFTESALLVSTFVNIIRKPPLAQTPPCADSRGKREGDSICPVDLPTRVQAASEAACRKAAGCLAARCKAAGCKAAGCQQGCWLQG